MAVKKFSRVLVIDVYARLSFAADGETIQVDDQVEMGREDVDRRGGVVGEVFKDNSLSAWKPRVVRPQWNTMMGRLESGASGELSGETQVSMNLWAFAPEIFPLLERSFEQFLASRPGPDQELVLPEAIDSLLRRGEIEVDVLPTRSIGFGLTHPEDLPRVSAMLRRLVEAGEYPQLLWDA